MPRQSERILLRAEATAPVVTSWAETNRWPLVRDAPAEDFQPAVLTWAAGREEVVEYVHEQKLGVHYLRTIGPKCSELAETARAVLPHWERDEILEIWDSAETVEVLEAATCALGIVASPGLDMEVMTRLARSLVHPSARVRFLAVRSTLIAGRPEMVPALLNVAQEDPNPDVRQHASSVAHQLSLEDA